MKEETGALWRIRPTDGPRGDQPLEPQVAPLYLLQLLVLIAGLLSLVALGMWFVKRLLEMWRSHA
jgi:hypothetical protein